MIREVHDRGFVGRRAVLDAEFVGKQAVTDFRAKISGIALFSIGAQITEMQNSGIVCRLFSGIPHSLVETVEAAVKMIHALVVFGKLIIDTVEGKLTPADAIGVTPNQRTEIKWIADVIVEPFVA